MRGRKGEDRLRMVVVVLAVTAVLSVVIRDEVCYVGKSERGGECCCGGGG